MRSQLCDQTGQKKGALLVAPVPLLTRDGWVPAEVSALRAGSCLSSW